MTKRGEIQNKEINRLVTTKPKKKKVLRYNEYYDTQALFDDLYEKSRKGYCFKSLIPLIKSEQNIMLAYRKIKRNKGSKTVGVDNKTISDIEDQKQERIVKHFQNKIDNYNPQKIRRVEIPKANGKKRKLGIPTIEDRIVQQCIKQILEPIAEAKFYTHSYGFRPNRSTHYAIGRIHSLINVQKLYYVVDVDIKGFFDNVSHAKLLKQLWAMGIQDKNLFCIIKKMLTSEIQGVGIPEIGTPQGGILSPLLSNIVLNELDWWVANQWETFETKRQYSVANGSQSSKYLSLKNNSNLKEMHIVRYADDFKIFCRDYKTANKVFIAVKMWLKERLQLEVSEEKSTITNLKKHYTEFLGVKFKVIPKEQNRYVIKSHVKEKAKESSINKLKIAISNIKKSCTTENVNKYNGLVLGLHNYYKIATMVSKDFYKIAFKVKKYLYNKLRANFKTSGCKSKIYKELYGAYHFKVYYVCKVALFPINGIKSKVAVQFNPKICNYTQSGRDIIHSKLSGINSSILRYLMQNPIKGMSIEYNDNRLSLYSAQKGMCAVTKLPLQIGEMETHHIIPKFMGGSDEYRNLIFVNSNVHKLIHAREEVAIKKYMDKSEPSINALNKINKLREKVGNSIIN